MNIYYRYYKLFVAIIFASVIILCSCSNSRWNKTEGMIWHTSYHITWWGPSELADSIMPTLMEIDASVNAFNKNALVSQLNQSPGGAIDNHFRLLFSESQRINKLSQGAFDPTLAPLITAWGFGKGHKATADTLKLDSLLELTGINRCSIDGGKLFKPNPNMQFNFSAIAKGYGCDCIGRMFKRNGVDNYMVEIGGEIACGGISPSGGKWHISIDKPIISNGEIHDSQCVIALESGGIATSGNYRNFHASDSNSTRYGHTISPLTGRPISTDILSATVIAPSAMEADALATALMAMPPRKAIKLANRLNYPVMLIMTKSVYMTPGFSKLIAN